jgi:hypothetical protein
LRFVNFEAREGVEDGRRRAWGYLVYDAPLTEKQIDDYELHAARDNPDVKALMRDRAQIVGKFEQAHRVPDIRRLTWWFPDFGEFAVKEHVTPDRLAELHEHIMKTKTLAAEKRAETETEKRVQVVGHWEEQKGLPDNERYTWHKPSIHAFALREPAVSREQLEQRYIRAKHELTAETRTGPAPKRIAEQLAEAEKYIERGADAPAKNRDKSHEDR